MGLSIEDAGTALICLPLPSDDAFEAVLLRARHDREIAAELAPRNRDALLEGLRRAGIAVLVVTYDGYGDSGQFNDWQATLATGGTVDLGTVATDVCVSIERPFDDLTTEVEFMPLTEAIESFCYNTLEFHHDGYESNEGGNGEFTFDVATGIAGLVHNDVVIDHDTTTHEL